MAFVSSRRLPALRGPRSRQVRVVMAGVALAGVAAGVWALVIGRDTPQMLLLLALGGSVAGIGFAYLSERNHRRHLQHLADSRDLLQQTVRSPLSVAALLGRLCQIFEAGFAEVVVLPDTPAGSALVVRVREGRTTESSEPLDGDLLGDVFSVIVPANLSLILHSGGAERGATVLSRRGLRDGVMAALTVEGRILGSVLVGRRRGAPRAFDDEDRRLLEALAPQVGVTVEKVQLDERINHQAFHDSLTGLANRSLFADRVVHALDRRVGSGRLRAALLFIDLDDFKVVNDSLGHPTGDLLLQAVTERLLRVVRPFDTVARLGGDEFAVLIEDLTGPEEAVLVAERFLEELAVSFDLEGTAIVIGASVGIAVAGAAATSCEDLLREADVAMYRAKQRGKATVETFDASMQRSLERGLQLRSDFEKAVAAGELHIEYQPVVALDTGRVVGVEALARWERRGRGPVAPRDFIPIAETSGLIHEVGEWVLRTACSQAVAWMAGHPQRDLMVGVNVSPRELLHPGFAQEVEAILRETGLIPALLTLEITESLLMEGPAIILERLQALKELGVTLAIDDFGTGYSSLGELRSLPVDALKIPKVFLDNITTEERERSFLAGIIGLGRTLDLRLVAVGVEREEQLHALREMRCDLAQGFHLAPPLDAAGVGEMLAREADTGPLDLSRRTWKAAQERAPQGGTARLPRSA